MSSHSRNRRGGRRIQTHRGKETSVGRSDVEGGKSDVTNVGSCVCVTIEDLNDREMITKGLPNRNMYRSCCNGEIQPNVFNASQKLIVLKRGVQTEREQ